MNDGYDSRPGPGQWLIFAAVAAWLALVPLVLMAGLALLLDLPPDLLVEIGAMAPGQAVVPEWALGLLATTGTLVLNLAAFLPLYVWSRERPFLRTVALLALAITAVQTLDALAGVITLLLPETALLPVTRDRTFLAALRLALVLPALLLGLGWMQARGAGRRQAGSGSLLKAWHRVGLRLWFHPSALWLALAAGAIIIWPWVVVGSLGSPGTTLATIVQALPNALNGEILFRGFALAWLWPAARGRTRAAAASLVLFMAAQGGTVLPTGDLAAPLRFLAALGLGLLATELTVRAGASIWPAVVVHFLYDWFHLAFVDPRSQEEYLHWGAAAWAPLVAGALGTALWVGRKLVESQRQRRAPRHSAAGDFAAGGLALLAWLTVLALYLGAGVPGFHPDGFLIYMQEQADLGPAAAIADPAERRAWVYDALVETAERTQGDLRAELDRRGVAYRPHYLVNAVEVLERPGLRRRLADWPGVDHVLFQPGVRRYAFPSQITGSSGGGSGVEWNVQEVGADRVWQQGYTGQDVIVGDADTGVDWQHPALREAYLGWQGSVAATTSHDYYWYDAWDSRAEPWDDHGHGTHTTGIVVGRDGQNQVGVAPGARWIACRNMRHGIGNPGSYLGCMEFLLAPFPIGGDPLRDGDPAQGAHVVNNSWGCPRREGCLPDTLRQPVENLQAAGQMMVVSAGNAGPACSTVEDPPALYEAVVSVGATQQDDDAAGFSSRGPVTADDSGRRKPDLMAPGVDVRSSVPGGYVSLPGTSMAGPHVAGVVALLWSADPSLIGDLEATNEILFRSAQRLTPDAVCPRGPQVSGGTVCACGTGGLDAVPNNVYGWGQVDAWAALQMLLNR
ncbi:MAG: S8 family serine peptidase [Anaerolineae bacterium]